MEKNELCNHIHEHNTKFFVESEMQREYIGQCPDEEDAIIYSIEHSGFSELEVGTNEYCQANDILNVDINDGKCPRIFKSGKYTLLLSETENLPSPSSIHRLSDMGELLGNKYNYDEWPLDWIQAVNNLNEWLDISCCGKGYDEAICTNGVEMLSVDYERENEQCCFIRKCDESDLKAWEAHYNELSADCDCSEELALLKTYREAYAQRTNPEHTYVVFFDDHVNGCAKLATFSDILSAKIYANEFACSHIVVDDEHPCSDDIFNSSEVCQCKVFVDGIMSVGEDMDTELVEPIYETVFFYRY